MGDTYRQRIKKLEKALRQAADHIDSASEVIADLDGDIDGECADARSFAQELRRLADGR